MFLNTFKSRNSNFIKTAAYLHQKGKIPPNCQILDLDTIEGNARIISKQANKYNIKVFAMSKQLGRNPDALDAIVRGGINSYVVLQFRK